MSKILRRPMFRGGAVDSRGTGITSGLFDAPSYNTGGRVGYDTGDLVKGMDLNPNLSKPLLIASSNTNLPKFKGQEYYEEKEEAEAYVPKYQKMEDFDNAYTEKVEKERESVDSLMGTEFGTNTYEDERQKDLSYLTSDQGKSDFIAKEQAKQDAEIKEANKYRDQKLKTSKEMFADPDEINLNELKITEEPEVDPKDLINENKELFKELLGADKARGQDIGDMLLRFSGSGGNTLGEKFQNYVKAESAAGPSRSEKIKQTAAGLAINDYVAGKRSKEQAEVLKDKIDYEYGKKAALASIQDTDDVSTALAKMSKLTDSSFDSLKNIKALITNKTGRSDIYQGTIKIDDLKKQNKLNKLKPGYNIIEDEGIKRIVEIGKQGDNNVVISIQTIAELWTG